MIDPTELLKKFHVDLQQAKTSSQLEDLRINYLGRNGQINDLLKSMKAIPSDQKKKYGQIINKLKREIEHELTKKSKIITEEAAANMYVDVTLPGTTYPRGSLHMVTHAISEIASIFAKIGFIRMSYPEIEWEYYSFESLNMPATHPARDDIETFFIDTMPDKKLGRMLLTPHTSSGQNREMKRLGKPPIRMINISKCYRPNWSPVHVPMFHQFEGLCVDENITIADLKGTINYFVKSYFGEHREIRLRPFDFRFTEPSFEVDITCDRCGGTGEINGEKCRVCKSGWVELGGSGMVHPNVLRAGGIDPSKYSGWAFGLGIERVSMMRQGLKLDDIRIMYSGDIRFLEQF